MKEEITQDNIPVSVLSTKQKKILSAGTWYHATRYRDYLSLKEKGIIVDHNAGSSLDFGYGFYLTLSEKMAEDYIARLVTWDKEHPVIEIEKDYMPVIIEYTLTPIEWFLGEQYNTALFPSYDDNFAEFVLLNRVNGETFIQQHNYDAIYGVMSDSLPTKLIHNYLLGEISREDVISGLKKGTSMKQLSLHNQELCNMLTMNRAYLYNPVTNGRKELDIYE